MAYKKPTILFYPMYLWGHIMPMRGMMKEFARRGHRVIVYATDEFKDVIEETGAYYVSCNDIWGDRSSTSLQLADVFMDQLSRRAEIEELFRESMARYSPAIAVIDHTHFIEKQSADKYKLPYVVSSCTIPPVNKEGLKQFWEDTFRHLDSYAPSAQKQLLEIRNNSDFINMMNSGMTLIHDADCIVYFSKSFLPNPEAYALEHLFFAGNKGETAGKKEPDKHLPGLPKKKTRPFVFVTMGTTGSYNPFFWMNCIRAFKDKDVDVVMILWKYLDKDMFADVPDHVKLIAEGDQKEYLKHADLMVCHGGLGTITDGLWAGVPMVLFPLVADQFQNCRIAEGLHAGITIDNYKAASISHAVDKILYDDSYRKSAVAMGDEMRQSGTTQELCDWILDRHTPTKECFHPKALSFQQCDMMDKYRRYTRARKFMNVGFVMDFPPEDGTRGVYALMKALSEFVKKNDGIRFTISEADTLPGGSTQQFLGEGYMPDIQIRHFKDRDIRYRGFLMKCYSEPFDLRVRAFLFRIAVFENGEFSLAAVFDHFNTDQHALTIANDAIKRLYTQILNGDEPVYAPPSFSDYVDRQSDYLLSKRYKKDVKFWRGYLKGLCDLFPDEEKELSDNYSIYRIKRVKQSAMLLKTAELFSVSVDTLGFVLYAILCGKYLKRNELFINRRYMNRIHNEDLELFANCRAVLPIHVSLLGRKTFGELCMEIQKDSIVVQRHGMIPGTELEMLMAECAGGQSGIPSMPGFGMVSESFHEIIKAFSNSGDVDEEGSDVSVADMDYKDLEIQLEQYPDGGISLVLMGRAEILMGCSGFSAFAKEMLDLCKRLNRDGDMELDKLLE